MLAILQHKPVKRMGILGMARRHWAATVSNCVLYVCVHKNANFMPCTHSRNKFSSCKYFHYGRPGERQQLSFQDIKCPFMNVPRMAELFPLYSGPTSRVQGSKAKLGRILKNRNVFSGCPATKCGNNLRKIKPK